MFLLHLVMLVQNLKEEDGFIGRIVPNGHEGLGREDQRLQLGILKQFLERVLLNKQRGRKSERYVMIIVNVSVTIQLDARKEC